MTSRSVVMAVRRPRLGKGVRRALGCARGWWCGAGCALLLLAASSGCTGIKPCDKRGLTEECDCDNGQKGVRVCLPERVWDHCACGSSPSDAGVAGKSGASGMSGVGGMSGGSGTSGMSGSSASGSGGSGGGMMQDPDEDAGTMPAGSGGSAGSAGSSGTGGSGGSSGSGGVSAAAAYKRCMNAAECGNSGATCESAVDPDDEQAMIRACAPACTDKSSCPMPSGSFTATLECIEGHCRLDCSAPLLGEPLTCPTGMRCASTGLLAPSYCF